MAVVINVSTNADEEIIIKLAKSLGIKKTELTIYADYSDFVLNLLVLSTRNQANLFSVGHATPALGIIADRADVRLTELLDDSPFSGSIDALLEHPLKANDIIFLSNPNRVTGASFTRADVEMLANAVPDGLLIVDEQYFDYYGISAVPLINKYSQIVVLRSFTAPYGISSVEAGYAVATNTVMSRFDQQKGKSKLSMATRKIVRTTIESSDAKTSRLAMVHGDTLRISTALNKYKIQNRITSTDFILLRVADPTAVGNYLARYRVSVDNLDGYPGLRHYLRYRILSPNSNDEFIKAFSKMDSSIYRLDKLDRRITTLRKGGEKSLSTNTGDSGNWRENKPVGNKILETVKDKTPG